jgi:hypothetical protein
MSDAECCPDDGTTPSPTPHNPHRELEPLCLNGLWWLCVARDPERIAYGVFTSSAQAEAYRQHMIDGWDCANRQRVERIKDGQALCAARRWYLRQEAGRLFVSATLSPFGGVMVTDEIKEALEFTTPGGALNYQRLKFGPESTTFVVVERGLP